MGRPQGESNLIYDCRTWREWLAEIGDPEHLLPLRETNKSEFRKRLTAFAGRAQAEGYELPRTIKYGGHRKRSKMTGGAPPAGELAAVGSAQSDIGSAQPGAYPPASAPAPAPALFAPAPALAFAPASAAVGQQDLESSSVIVNRCIVDGVFGSFGRGAPGGGGAPGSGDLDLFSLDSGWPESVRDHFGEGSLFPDSDNDNSALGGSGSSIPVFDGGSA